MIFRYKIKFISDIEQKIRKLLVNIAVTPFVGVWIEMNDSTISAVSFTVTPFVGVWIEIGKKCTWELYAIVTPFVGVWIEILYKCLHCTAYSSLPSWECGLKFLWLPVIR